MHPIFSSLLLQLKVQETASLPVDSGRGADSGNGRSHLGQRVSGRLFDDDVCRVFIFSGGLALINTASGQQDGSFFIIHARARIHLRPDAD